MKTKNKIILSFGISLMLVSLSIIVLSAESNTNQQELKIKPLEIELMQFHGFGFHYQKEVNESYISFDMKFVNPNNENVKVKICYLQIFDESGNLLVTFKPVVDEDIDCLQISTEQFDLDKDILLSSYKWFSRSYVGEFVWSYLRTYSGNVSISVIYSLNDNLHYIESNLCEINFPI